MLPDFPDRLARYAGRRGLPLPQPPYDAAALGLREQDLLVLAGTWRSWSACGSPPNRRPRRTPRASMWPNSSGKDAG